MANLSDVINGRMTLEGEWTKIMINNLNIIKEEWGKGERGNMEHI